MLASNKLGVPPFNFANFNLKVMSEDKHKQAEKQFVYSFSFVRLYSYPLKGRWIVMDIYRDPKHLHWPWGG